LLPLFALLFTHNLTLLYHFIFFLLRVRRPPKPPLFPYTTLFRSKPSSAGRCRQAIPVCNTNKIPCSASRSGSAAGDLVCVAYGEDRKSTRLNSSHQIISYAVFCLTKKNRRQRGESSSQTEKQPTR